MLAYMLMIMVVDNTVKFEMIYSQLQVENCFGFSLQLLSISSRSGINGLKWRLIFPGERENIQHSRVKKMKRIK